MSKFSVGDKVKYNDLDAVVEYVFPNDSYQIKFRKEHYDESSIFPVVGVVGVLSNQLDLIET